MPVFQFLHQTLLRLLKHLNLVKLLIFMHITKIYFEPEIIFFGDTLICKAFVIGFESSEVKFSYLKRLFRGALILLISKIAVSVIAVLDIVILLIRNSSLR